VPRLLASTGVALCAIYLVFLGGTSVGTFASGLRIASVSLAAVVLLTWSLVALRRPSWRPRSVLLPAMLACLGSMAVSTAFSRVPRVSLEYLGYAVLLAALYLLLVRLMASPDFRTLLVGLAAVMFVVTSAVFIVLVADLWVSWWQAVGRLAIPPLRPNFISLTWNNPSAILIMVALLAIPTAAPFSSTTRRGITVFIAIGLTVAVVALLTGSRAGWLALAVAGLVGVISLFASRDRRTALRLTLFGGVGGRVPIGLRVAAVVAVTAIAIGTVEFLPAILQRAGAGGENLRLGFYAAALRIFATSPIVGTGPGTWVILRPAFTQTDEADYYIPHAHDVPVQTLAELGLVGALAGVVLVASLLWLVWSAARSSDGHRARWGWLTGLGLLYFGVHNLLDFYPNMPAALFAAALPVAYLDATSEGVPAIRGRRLPASLAGVASIAGMATVVFAWAGLALLEMPVRDFDRAVGSANQGSWAEALAPARAAAAADPNISPYNLAAGLAAARAGDDAGAAAYFERVTNQDDVPEAWLDLAAEQALLGRHDDAAGSLTRAMRLGLQRVEVALPAGDLAMRLGRVDLAIEAFADSVDQNPTLAGDPWWQADAARAAIFPEVLKRALGNAGIDGQWVIELMAGDLDSAATLAATSSDPRGNGRIVAAWRGDPSALQGLMDHCSAEPLDTRGLAWCARLEDRAGDHVSADRYRSEAEADDAGSSSSSLTLRVTGGDSGHPHIAPTGAFWWAIYTYRRLAPEDLLVPSLIHVELK
jgi:O-antigen ligase